MAWKVSILDGLFFAFGTGKTGLKVAASCAFAVFCGQLSYFLAFACSGKDRLSCVVAATISAAVFLELAREFRGLGDAPRNLGDT